MIITLPYYGRNTAVITVIILAQLGSQYRRYYGRNTAVITVIILAQ
jgi:phage tail protein X